MTRALGLGNKNLRVIFRRRGTLEMAGALDKMGHLPGRVDCQRMRSEAWPRRNIGCHLAHQIELMFTTAASVSPQLSNAELVQLQVRVIALENLVIALLSQAPDPIAASCGPSGPAPPSLSHLDKARSRSSARFAGRRFSSDIAGLLAWMEPPRYGIGAGLVNGRPR